MLEAPTTDMDPQLGGNLEAALAAVHIELSARAYKIRQQGSTSQAATRAGAAPTGQVRAGVKGEQKRKNKDNGVNEGNIKTERVAEYTPFRARRQYEKVSVDFGRE